MQLGLFGGADAPRLAYLEEGALARRLPPGLRFGTCSWAFPGWRGIVYAAPGSRAQLAREGLREYARHPLLRAVEVDRSYYAPVPEDDWRRYADQVPDDFRFCVKAPAAVSSPVDEAGDRNPDFLSPNRLVGELLEPALRHLGPKLGPVVVQLPALPSGRRLDPAALPDRTEAFLERLPRERAWALELRDDRLLTPAWRDALRRHGAAHVYSYWSAMPTPAAQERRVPLDGADLVLMRLMLRPGARYAERRDAMAPFDRIATPDPRLRAEVEALARRALEAGRPVWVMVNNKAEGSAPLTVRALAESLGAPA